MNFFKSLNFDTLLSQIAASSGATQGVMLALATFFISEDLTTLAAGLMVAQGQISWATAFWGCFLGIFLGDGLLYLLGLLVGRPVLSWPLFRHMLSQESVKKGERWFENHGIAMVFASRFLPGTRLPTYFSAGLLGAKARYFMVTALLACAIWTPMLLAAAFWFGKRVLLPFEYMQQHPFLTFGTGVFLLFGVFKTVHFFLNTQKRALLKDRIYRVTHWEFWPLKIFYAPVFFYNLLLALRFRSLHAPLYANPAIPFSGFVGESKTKIIELFKNDPHLLPQVLFLPEDDLEGIGERLKEQAISFPLILKPDQGARGSGVKKITSLHQLQRELKNTVGAQILQARHPGPLEYGISYVCLPGQKGRIMGITGKKFPTLIGDGASTQQSLLLKNPDIKGRLRLFQSHINDEILEKGEHRQLVEIGNHCLGTLFNDQSHLKTSDIEDAVNKLAQISEGVNIGRFDVRATSEESFKRGEFKLLEFNGATSEPSYVYDRSFSLFQAWYVFFEYWKYMWQIGHHQQQQSDTRLTWKALFTFSSKSNMS